MKKILLTAIIAMMATASASAQIEEGCWYVTPKAGVGISDMTSMLFDVSKQGESYDATLKPMVTFTGGVDFEYAIVDQLGFGFGLNYARKGSRTQDDLFKIKMDYFNIPLTMNFYPIPEAGLALKAGVQVGFAARKRLTNNGTEYNADSKLAGTGFTRWGRPVLLYVETELSRKFNKVDFSIPLALSYEYKGFTLEARYNLGLTKVMKEDPESSQHRVWQFTLGYKIFMGDN